MRKKSLPYSPPAQITKKKRVFGDSGADSKPRFAASCNRENPDFMISETAHAQIGLAALQLI